MSAKHSGSVAEASQKGPFFPLGYEGTENTSTRGTATCFCGGVRLGFPTEKPGLVDTFICNCADCRKITASTFASNFIVKDDELTHIRGEDQLTRFAQNKTVDSGEEMANYFCKVCGTLMYRRSTGFPKMSVMRIGTVDDFHLHETKLKPRVEQFTKDRASWLHGAKGVEQQSGNYFDPRKSKA